MRGVNKVFLLGHVGRDPEFHLSAQKIAVARFTLATNRSSRSDEGWQEETDWHRIVCFDKQAQRATAYAKRGAALAIVGEIRYRRWHDKSNQPRITAEIICHQMALASKAKDPLGENGQRPQAESLKSVTLESSQVLPESIDLPLSNP